VEALAPQRRLGNLEAGALGSLTSPTISALTGGLITVAAAVAIGAGVRASGRGESVGLG
jgi:hypothetical protein